MSRPPTDNRSYIESSYQDPKRVVDFVPSLGAPYQTPAYQTPAYLAAPYDPAYAHRPQPTQATIFELQLALDESEASFSLSQRPLTTLNIPLGQGQQGVTRGASKRGSTVRACRRMPGAAKTELTIKH